MIQSRVINEFHDELERAQQPGYVSRYDDDFTNEWVADEPDTAHGQAESDTKIEQVTRSDRAHSRRSGPHRDKSRKAGRSDKDQFGQGILE